MSFGDFVLRGYGGDTPRFPEGDGPARVALVEHPDPLCRMRSMVSLQRDGTEYSYEIRERREVSMVESLLGLRRGRPFVRQADDYTAPRMVMYFDLPPGASPEAVAGKLSQLLLGEVKSFYAVAMEQNAFHEAHGVFDILRKVAGNPRVVISRHEGGGGSGNLFESARNANLGVAASTAVTMELREQGDNAEQSAERKDRFQRNGASVKIQPDAPADCPVCGMELVDTPYGKSCPEATEPARELCGLCGEPLVYDDKGISSCSQVASGN